MVIKNRVKSRISSWQQHKSFFFFLKITHRNFSGFNSEKNSFYQTFSSRIVTWVCENFVSVLKMLDTQQTTEELLLNIVVLGSPSSGKHSLIQYFVDGSAKKKKKTSVPAGNYFISLP